MEDNHERSLQDGPHLVVHKEDGQDGYIALLTPVTVGRRTSNELQILDPTVSREHVRITHTEEGGHIEDLGSTHGTFVNDIRVTSRQPLSHNDRIRLGRANNNTMIYRTHREFSDLMETAEEIEPTAENLRNLWALLEISKALNSSLRLDDVLEKVIEAVLALTRAERGILLLGEDPDQMEIKVQRNFDASGSENARYSSTVVRDVVTRGEPRILTDAAQDERFSGQESIVGLSLRTVMCVPLRLGHRRMAPLRASAPDDATAAADYASAAATDAASEPGSVSGQDFQTTDLNIIGVIYVDRRSPTRFFTAQDLALFESFASHAALAIENARLFEEALEKRRMESDLEIAREIQQSLLPHEFPELSWASIYGFNQPARQVGGDYYDVFLTDDGDLGFAVGDVSGKGVPASLVMSTLQSSFLAESSAHDDIAKVCERVNEFLVQRTTPERYATFFAARLMADGTLLYVNAGHNPPMLLRGDEVHRLSGGGLPLGLFRGRTYELQKSELQPGDLLLVFTDGVTEANDPAENEFGEERLLEVVRANIDADVRSLTEKVFAAIAEFSRGLHNPHDDITLLTVRRH
ncbi:MAG: SpoIIE family protein phosphatase [Acidobacteria bacterium]|nr:SpoIIE family protein phosphatase [Acidobacteriota bacterium]